MPAETEKLADSIDELSEESGLGRTFIYEEIKAGRLKAKKAGRRTLVLREESRRWLRGLPDMTTATATDR